MVIYVLLKPICCGNRANRSNLPFVGAQISQSPHNFTSNSAPVHRKSSSSLRQHKPSLDTENLFNNESITLNEDSRNFTLLNSYSHANTNLRNELVSASLSPVQHRSAWSVTKLCLLNIFKEKLSVTNFYLFNLALTDFLYLATIPILICTIHFKAWVILK